MNRSGRWLTIFATSLLLTVNLSAQVGPRALDWPQLRRAAENKHAMIRLRDGGALKGRIAISGSDALTVGGRSVTCAEIASVETKKGSRRALWAIVGGAAGLAAGARIGTRFSNEGNAGAAAGVAVGLAGAGAGLGYAAGGKGKSESFTLAQGACPR